MIRESWQMERIFLRQSDKAKKVPILKVLIDRKQSRPLQLLSRTDDSWKLERHICIVHVVSRRHSHFAMESVTKEQVMNR